MADPASPIPSSLHALLLRNAELEAEVKWCRKELQTAEKSAVFVARTLIAQPRTPTVDEELSALRAQSQHLHAKIKKFEALQEAETTGSGGLITSLNLRHENQLKNELKINADLRRGLESERRKFQTHIDALTLERDDAVTAFDDLKFFWKDFCARNNLPSDRVDAAVYQILSSMPPVPATDGSHHRTSNDPGALHDRGSLATNSPESMHNHPVPNELKSSALFWQPSRIVQFKTENKEQVDSAKQIMNTSAQAAPPTTAGTSSMMESQYASAHSSFSSSFGSHRPGTHTPRHTQGSTFIDHNGSRNYVERFTRRDRDRERGGERSRPFISDDQIRSLAGQACFIEDMSFEEQMDFWESIRRKWPSHSANDWRSVYCQQIRPKYLARAAARGEKPENQDSTAQSAIERSNASTPAALDAEAEDGDIGHIKAEAEEQGNLIDFEEPPSSTIIDDEHGVQGPLPETMGNDDDIQPSPEAAASHEVNGDLGAQGATIATLAGVDSISTGNLALETAEAGQDDESEAELFTPDTSVDGAVSQTEADDEFCTIHADDSGHVATSTNPSSTTTDAGAELEENRVEVIHAAEAQDDTTSGAEINESLSLIATPAILSFSSTNADNELEENNRGSMPNAAAQEDTVPGAEIRDDHAATSHAGPLVAQSASAEDRLMFCKSVEQATALTRRPSSYHFDESYPLHSTGPLSTTMVVISGIPEDTELVSVLDRVCNGRIVSASMCMTGPLKTKRGMGGKTALIVFANPQEAKDYVDFRRSFNLVLYSADNALETVCGVDLVPTATNPCRLFGSIQMADAQPRTRRLFFRFGYDSKVVFTARRLLEWMAPEEFRRDQIRMYGAALKDPLRSWDGQNRFVGMEFASVKAATLALQFFRSFPILTRKGISMGFYPDQCEQDMAKMYTEEQSLRQAFQEGSIL